MPGDSLVLLRGIAFVELANAVAGQLGPPRDRPRASLVLDQPPRQVEAPAVVAVSILCDSHECLVSQLQRFGSSRLVGLARGVAGQPTLDLGAFPTLPTMPLRKCARAHPAIQRASVMVDDSHDIGRSEEGVIGLACIAATAIARDDYRVVP